MNGRSRYLTGQIGRHWAFASALFVIIAASAACLAPTTASAAEDNIILDPRVTPIRNLPHGPFVRLADGGILGVSENSAIVTHDDGKTWQPRPIFQSGENFKIRPERAMMRTRAGTIILIFSNDADFIKDWTKIVCFGDSTTAPRRDLVIYADLLREELSGREIDIWVQNSGVGSSHTDHARERFARDVLDHRPELAIIQFGINDSAVDVWKNPPATQPRVALARYRENLNFFIDTLRQQNGKVILMTPNPLRWAEKTQKLYGRPPYDPNDPDGFNRLLKDYAAAVRQIATAQDVELIDVYALFESYDRQANQSIDDLLLDGMHPNATGHRLVADLLLEEIDRLLASRPADE